MTIFTCWAACAAAVHHLHFIDRLLARRQRAGRIVDDQLQVGAASTSVSASPLAVPPPAPGLHDQPVRPRPH